MKLIIAGSRGIEDFETVKYWCDLLFEKRILRGEEIDVVCGMAKGVDRLGERWANSYKFPVTKFPPDWDKWGKQAGIFRNIQMSHYADELLAFWDGKSKGTLHMISTMMTAQKPFQVILCT